MIVSGGDQLERPCPADACGICVVSADRPERIPERCGRGGGGPGARWDTRSHGNERAVAACLDRRGTWRDLRQPADSIDIFHALSSAIGPPTEAWLFHRDRATLVPGFYYPLVARERYGIPKGVGPQVVLIDEIGDHLWLSGAWSTGLTLTVLAATW